jgi:hypothetical protein
MIGAGRVTATDVTFPRLNGRGPIEAPSTAISLPSGREFPRLNGRGPIEAAVPL